LLDGVDLIADVLAQASGIKLLVTSRQRLDLQQEWSFALGEFNLPAAPTAEEMEANSAVTLFTQSARRAHSGFNLAPADYAAVTQICRLVGGLPLGIELAASWTRLLSCAEIAQEIEQGLDFLAVSTRNMPAQHQNLRAVFDQSWTLLTPAEQQLLQALTIFQGSFTRPAAADVAGATLSLLSGLIDKSLLRRQGADRYSLHELIRQYAAERLQADGAAYQEVKAKHGRCTLQWLAEQEAVLRGPGQKNGLTAVAGELANVRAAWRWAVENRQSDRLRPAAFSLFYFYELRGLQHEGEAAFRLAAESLQQAVDVTDRETQVALCAMQTYQAYLSFRTGKMALAETLLHQAMARLRTLGDDTLLGYAARHLGLIEWSLGRFEEALNLLQTSLTVAERQEDRWGMAMAQVYRGLIMQDQGQLTAARQQLTAAQPAVTDLGDSRLLGTALLIAGRTNLLLGHLAEAEQQLAACLEATRETNDPNSILYATHYLGLVKQAQGDLSAARQLIEQSVTLFAEFNDLVGLERASVTVGFLEIAAGNFEAAESHFLMFLRARRRDHAVRYILTAVLGTAVVRAHFGDPFTALVWASSVLRHPGLDWESRRRAETLCAELHVQLTVAQITQAQQEAAGQPFDAILSSIVGR
jgi:predicted ATPase